MPQFPVRPAVTHALPIEDVAARLSHQPEVDGVVMMGSGGAGALSPASDIDLLVVLDGWLAPVKMLSTHIDGRLAEVYFTQAHLLDNWLAERPRLPQDSFAAVQLGWIAGGQVLFDRAARLAKLRAALHTGEWSSPPDDAAIYAAWFQINYDLVQTRRLVSAEDPVSRIKAELRLPRLLIELWERYFTVRRLPALSEKGRVRWMLANDPAFLAALRSCLAVADLARKFERFVELAAAVLQPAGGLWPDAITAADLDGGEADAAGEVLTRWDSWLKDS